MANESRRNYLPREPPAFRAQTENSLKAVSLARYRLANGGELANKSAN
jgi:hypothetical protein